MLVSSSEDGIDMVPFENRAWVVDAHQADVDHD